MSDAPYPPLSSLIRCDAAPRVLTESLLIAASNSALYDRRPLTPIPVTPRDYDWWLNYLGITKEPK